MADDEFLEGVGKTALGVAMVRAGESRRSDRLFDDPHAAAFIAAAPHAFDDEQRVAGRMLAASSASSWGVTFAAHAVLRTRFFDDYLLDATAGGIRQVVLLGAGLDTRAFRLAWPDGLHVYELDLPDVLDFKDRVLTEQAAKPACGRHVVAADLREGITGPLMRAGLSAAARTAWLLEGLLIYLSAADAERLLCTVTGLSAPGSRLASEFDNDTVDQLRAQTRREPTMHRYSALWKGGLPNTVNWLTDHGWQPQLHERVAVPAGYGRPLADAATGGFVIAARC